GGALPFRYPAEHVADDAIAALAEERERARQCRLGTRHERLLEERAGAMEPRLHGLFGDAEALGSFGCRELLDRSKHEDGAEAVGERVDGPFDEGAYLSVGGMLFWITITS